MTRVFIRVLIFLLSFSFIAENYLVYKGSIVSCIADDSCEEKSEPVKEKKGDYEEKFFSRHTITYTTHHDVILKPSPFSESLFSSGYFDKPFTPPDFL